MRSRLARLSKRERERDSELPVCRIPISQCVAAGHAHLVAVARWSRNGRPDVPPAPSPLSSRGGANLVWQQRQRWQRHRDVACGFGRTRRVRWFLYIAHRFTVERAFVEKLTPCFKYTRSKVNRMRCYGRPQHKCLSLAENNNADNVVMTNMQCHLSLLSFNSADFSLSLCVVGLYLHICIILQPSRFWNNIYKQGWSKSCKHKWIIFLPFMSSHNFD